LRLTETIHGYSGIINNEIYPLGMFCFQKLGKALDTLYFRNVEGVVPNIDKPAVRYERLCLFELGIVFDTFEGLFTPGLISRRQVN
jgi:hypothetical protein